MTTKSEGRPRGLRADGAASKQAIIDAGVALFSGNGYDATGVQEIVDRAGLTKGSFYHAFPGGKDDLLRHIQDQFIDRCLSALDDVSQADDPPDVALSKAIAWFIAIVGEQHAELSIFFQEARYLSRELFADVRRKRDLFEEKFTALLVAGQRDGTFRNVPSRITSFGVIGMCAWAYHWMRPDFGPTSDIAQIYTDVLLNGLYAETYRGNPGRNGPP
jgi:AcrR family transcriptional regulator